MSQGLLCSSGKQSIVSQNSEVVDAVLKRPLLSGVGFIDHCFISEIDLF